MPHIKASKKLTKAIEISSEDLNLIKIGLQRLLANGELKLYNILPALKWLSSSDTISSKLFARPLFEEIKELVAFIYANIFDKKVFNKLKEEPAGKWMNFLITLRSLEITVGSKRPESVKTSVIDLIKDKRGDQDFWRIVLVGNIFLDEDEFEEAVEVEWLEHFSKKLIFDIKKLGQELYGQHFPNADAYWKARRATGDTSENLKTRRNWYPLFLICQAKIHLLKQTKGKTFNQNLLLQINEDWNALIKVSTTAKNRHKFIVSKGWWEEN